MTIRIIAALAVLVSAFVHLHLWMSGIKSAHVVGPAFMVNTVAGVLIAVLLLAWRSWPPPLLAAGFGVATMVAFILSTTTGLFGFHDVWSGGYVFTAFIVEAIAVVTGLAALWREGWLHRASAAPRLPASGHATGHRA